MANRLPLGLVALLIPLCATDALAAVGRTVGQFAVSPTGSAQYSIPIWAPPGPHGVQPHIALTYNSQQGNGYVGVGWAVSGLSSIYRCNRTIAQDGAAAPVALATSDGYCMDGQRLRLTAGTYGTASSTYQTEIANFVNVEAYGSAGNGPAYWQATDRNGWQYTYGGGGTTSNAEVLASGSTTADSWQLNEVKDPSGNSMTITYSTSNVTGVVVPHVISWVPASAGSSSYNYTMTFSYGTTGSVHGYVGGTPFNNTNLLSSIAIAYQGTAQKTYYLTYSNTTTATSRYLLTEFQECAGTGTSNCLAPTNVTWQAGAAGVGSGTAVSGTVGSVVSTAFDLNGDGRNDLVMITSAGAVLVAFGGSSGYGTPVPTGLSSNGAVGDIDGSGVAGILAKVSGTWYYYKWNGSAFVGASTGISVATAASPVLADLDADGRADFVYTDSTGIVHVRLSTSSAGTVSFSPTDINSGIGGANFSISAQFNGSNRALHFWGGAQADLFSAQRTCAQYNAKGICIAYQYIYYELHFTGSTFIAWALPNTAVDFADYNDDGCTDILTATQLLLSACDGTAPISVALPAGVTAVGGIDWNGDGRRDVLVAQSSGTLGVVLSTGTGLASTVINTSYSTSSLSYTAAPNLTGDGQDGLIGESSAGTSVTYYLHNGPGAPPDLLTSVTDGYGNKVSAYYTSIAQSNYTITSDATYPYQNYIGPFFVVYSATFSDPSQAPGQTYSQSFHYDGAWMNLQGRGFQGFQNRSTTDSRTVLYEYQWYERAFPYTGMMYEDVWGTGSVYPSIIEGFPATITLSSTTNQQRYFPYFSSTTHNEVEVGGAENGDAIRQTVTTYTYDNYGNATQINTTVTDQDPGSPYKGDTWTTEVTNTTDISANQSADLAAWCLSLIDETQVAYSSSLSGSSSVTRTKTFTPDTPALCRIKTITTEPTANSGAYKVTKALTFDSFGNVVTDTVTGANMPASPASRLTTLNWGTTGQFLNTLTDPSGATMTWTYSSNQALTFGVPDSLKNANNLTTSWTYDAFGRKSKETRPDSTSTTWTWSACTSYCGWSNSVYQIAQTAYQTNGSTAIRTDTTSYDPIDRVTQSSGPTVTGATSTVQSSYNPMGLLAQQSMPFLSGTPYLQSYLYDTLNRVSSITRPISSTNSAPQSTNYFYAGRQTTVSDPNGHTTNTIADVNGWLRRATDGLGFYVTRTYDSAGSLNGITDSVGNTLLKNVTVVYGIKPFITAATDADRGAWTYTVDSLGERIGWKDAKGQSFTMTYDALSRPLSRTEPDLFTEWNYGSAAPNWGRTTSECTASTATTNFCTTTGSSWLYNEVRAYDSMARPSTRSITQSGNTGGNDGGGAFLYTFAYSATTGLLNTLTYPKSTSSFALTLQYGYGYGLLSSVTDTTDTIATCGTTCTLWTANSMNAFGEVTQETLGNGVVTNRTYDAVTSWLSAATGGVGGGATLLNQSYLQDKDGNIIQRQNNTLGLTESFAYDADNRLSCSALASTCTTPTMVYDGGVAGPGNITSQTGVGTYAYPAAGQPQPHAVTSLTGTFNGIVNPTFSYDLNGNMTSRAGSTISWFSNNYPATISASDVTGTEELQFSYGPDRQRWEQVYTGPSGTETTYYIGGLIDLVFTGGVANYRQYIYAGAEPVAVYSRTAAGVNTMSYMLEDHQGGISAIASSAGTVNGTTGINESFSAFGARRSPTTWSGAPSTPDLDTIAGLSRQGYTFQTWLGQSMGLNHMNGRVEDAILGRFLSPDPNITDRTNAQSYNRYSYVNNNPLTLIDPTGFDNKPCASSGCPGGTPWNPAQGGQWGWSCYGNCGAGYANSIGTVTWPGGGTTSWAGSPPSTALAQNQGQSGSSANSIAAFNQWATGWIDPSLASSGAQSQTSPSQTSSDGLQEIVVTAQSTAQNGSQFAQGPLLAQEAPFIDPFLEAIRTRPVSPAEFGKTPQYTPRVGVPEPLPEPPPQNFWYQLFNLFKSAGSYIDNILGIAPPVCPTCVPA